jgi:Cof subfamily protein (haloacid dehalogenase superfamily)
VYKIVFSDLDGTLVPHSGVMSEYSKQVIGQVRALGIPMILASGRSSHSMRPFYEDLQLDEPMISYNGALVEGLKQGDYTQSLEPEHAKSLYDFAVKAGYYFQFYYQGDLYTIDEFAEHPFFTMYRGRAKIEWKSVPKDSPQLYEALSAITKWSFIEQDRAKLEKIAGEAQALLAGQVGMSYTSSEYFEIYHKLVNKGNATLKVLQEYGLKPEQAISFGDNYNDIELLQVVGAGYAMSNAADGVKAEAFGVTEFSVDEDGVAKMLAKLFLQNK